MFSTLLAESISNHLRARDFSRLVFPGRTGALSLLAEGSNDEKGEIIHFELPDSETSKGLLDRLDPIEFGILAQYGAFSLPPQDICDTLIKGYFEQIHPLLPMINRTQFMRDYENPSNPPSILLLQAILAAGTLVCQIPDLLDSNGTMDHSRRVLYKRAKSLYDAGCETDKITIVQAMLLMSCCCSEPASISKDMFYWTKLAISVAQGLGLHRSVENSHMRLVDRRLWKRLWWVLFTRDRVVSISLGRPFLIDKGDSDVEPLSPSDFLEEEGPGPYRYPPDSTLVQFFIRYTSLSEIATFIIEEHFSVSVEHSRRTVKSAPPDITRSELALRLWLKNLPPELDYDYSYSQHTFWTGILYAQFNCLHCLIHRWDLSPHGKTEQPKDQTILITPNRQIAFETAHNIAKITENLSRTDEISKLPSIMVHVLFTALIAILYELQTLITDKEIAEAQRALDVLVKGLRTVSTTWGTARTLLGVFMYVARSLFKQDDSSIKARLNSAVQSPGETVIISDEQAQLFEPEPEQQLSPDESSGLSSDNVHNFGSLAGIDQDIERAESITGSRQNIDMLCQLILAAGKNKNELDGATGTACLVDT
ncbi:fungal-specific transcription factor domain-containing protein [Myxozyma melibiosi]|uniref:Fungal-specific transcription factor domain-containing protein n=1 Tax=Myxozyma melibiosi TaxID=54550 RepID=A0ABR1EZJ4_9ASCO